MGGLGDGKVSKLCVLFNGQCNRKETVVMMMMMMIEEKSRSVVGLAFKKKIISKCQVRR